MKRSRFTLNLALGRAALPLILSNLVIPVVNFVNSYLLGHLTSHRYLAALGVGLIIFGMLYFPCNALRMGTTGLVAKASGQNDQEEIHQVLYHGLLLAVMIGTAFILLQWPILQIAYWSLPKAKPVAALVGDYFRWRILGAPAFVVNYVVIGAFIAIGKTKPPLVISVVITLVASVLGFLFVHGMGITLAGVGVADSLAQMCGAVVGLMLLHREFDLKQLHQQVSFSWHKCRYLLSVKRDIFLRTLMLVLFYSLFSYYSAEISLVVLAANTIMLDVLLFLAYFLDGVTNVCESIVGRAFGRGERDALHQVVMDAIVWVGLIAMALCALCLVGGGWFIQAMTTLTHVQTSIRLVWWLLALSPLVSAFAYLADGVAIGLNRFNVMRDGVAISLVVFFVFYTFLKPYANQGLWVAFLLFQVSRAATTWARLRSTIWGKS